MALHCLVSVQWQSDRTHLVLLDSATKKLTTVYFSFNIASDKITRTLHGTKLYELRGLASDEGKASFSCGT